MKQKPTPHARDIMTKRVTTLLPTTTLLEASRLLTKKAWLCAPVVGTDGKFIGVFSQQCAMRALVDAIYDEIPSTEVQAYLDPKPVTVSEDATMVRCAQTFADPKHRGPAIIVLREDKVVGIVSRLDVLAAVVKHLSGVKDKASRLLYLSALRPSDEETNF
ncbi:MAG: CBS domain-containing protein [Planctomycetota bacterium]|jgi:CBS domain-containing protein